MSGIHLRAHAKLNLTLEVLGRRVDGYHEVVSVMQSISVSDDFTFAPASNLTLECDDPALNGDDNLVLRAARLLRERYPRVGGARITLSKGIPVASGLGGGSADAAAALVGLNALWSLGLPAATLQDLGATLGSDVPFCIAGGTALARGRGERLEPLPPLAAQWFVVVRPPVDLPAKTAAMYRLLPPSAWTTGAATVHLAATFRADQRLREAALFNGFSNTAATAFPECGACRRDLLEASWARPVLAGAGPAWFILVSGRAEGEAIAAMLRGEPYGVWLVHSVPRGIQEIPG